MSRSYVLLQYGSDPWQTRFEDLEGRLAFTTVRVDEKPNLVLKLSREAPWSQQHPDIMGPGSSFFYFGPLHAPGYLAYGNSEPVSMTNSLKAKRDPNTRGFISQRGDQCKWKVSPERLECYDGRSSIAVWEIGKPDDVFHGRLTIKESALPIVTELLTTLTLNQIAQRWSW